MKLYELAEAFQRLTDMEDEAFEVALGQLSGEISDKVENVAKVVRTLEAEANVYKQEIDHLLNAAQARLNRTTALKQYLLANMEAVGIDKVKGALFTVSVLDSPPSCQILDEEAVPLEYKERIESWKIDRKGLIAAWKAGGDIPPGAVITQGRHIRIR